MGEINLEYKKLGRVTFDEEVKESIDKKDGIHSIVYYVYNIMMIWLFGLLIFKTQIYTSLEIYFNSKDFFKFLFYMPFVIIQILPVFIILYFKKQTISSIGIKKDKIMKSTLIGIIGSIPFSILNIIGPISSGKTLNPSLVDNFWIFLFFLICIGFVEEIIFRGFLQTRIEELMKSKWTSTIFVGIMFGLMHVPIQMIQADMSLIEFIVYDLGHLIITSLMHIYFVYLYTRDKNIIAPTVAHAIINFSYAIFV